MAAAGYLDHWRLTYRALVTVWPIPVAVIGLGAMLLLSAPENLGVFLPALIVNLALYLVFELQSFGLGFARAARRPPEFWSRPHVVKFGLRYLTVFFLTSGAPLLLYAIVLSLGFFGYTDKEYIGFSVLMLITWWVGYAALGPGLAAAAAGDQSTLGQLLSAPGFWARLGRLAPAAAVFGAALIPYAVWEVAGPDDPTERVAIGMLMYAVGDLGTLCAVALSASILSEDFIRTRDLDDGVAQVFK